MSVSEPAEPDRVEAPTDRVQVSVDWSSAGEMPPAYTNQFVVQLGPPTRAGLPDGIYITLGSLSPPLIFTDNQAAREASIRRAREGVKPTIHGRFYLTKERLDELIVSLQTIADAYNKVAGDINPSSEWIINQASGKS